MSASSDVRAVEELGRRLSRLLGGGVLPPEAEEALRSLIALSGRLASDKAEMAATIAAQAGQIAELMAQITVITGQIAQLQRDLYGSRSEKRKEGGDASDGKEGPDSQDSRRGGKPGRRKDRGDAVNGSGLRFNDKAPVVDITVTPPEIEGLPEDDYEMVSERVHCRLAALEYRHVVIRYHHIKVSPRQRQRRPPRSQGRGRREQALLQALGPDEEAAMLETENLHHVSPPVDEDKPPPAGRVLPEMGRDQRAQPVEAAAHVRRLRRQPDAARRPAAEHQDRRRRSTTPSPSDSSTSQPGPDAAAISTKPPGLPRAAAAVRPNLRRHPWNVFNGTPRALQKLT